jgi:hypothetical protein
MAIDAKRRDLRIGTSVGNSGAMERAPKFKTDFSNGDYEWRFSRGEIHVNHAGLRGGRKWAGNAFAGAKALAFIGVLRHD